MSYMKERFFNLYEKFHDEEETAMDDIPLPTNDNTIFSLNSPFLWIIIAIFIIIFIILLLLFFSSSMSSSPEQPVYPSVAPEQPVYASVVPEPSVAPEPSASLQPSTAPETLTVAEPAKSLVDDAPEVTSLPNTQSVNPEQKQESSIFSIFSGEEEKPAEKKVGGRRRRK